MAIEVANLSENEVVDLPLGFVFNSKEGKGYGVVTDNGLVYHNHFGQAWSLSKKIKKSKMV